MAKMKPRKVNVEMPGLEDLEVPPDAPPEAAKLMKLLQKAYTNPEGLSETEFAKFMEMANAMTAAADAAIDPEDRQQAAEIGARAFGLWQANRYEEAFEKANEALDFNPQEPSANIVDALLSIEDDQEAFEAMSAISMQVDFELQRDNGHARIALLEAIRNLAHVQCGIAAYQCGHFESAIGPLMEALELGDGEQAGVASLFLVPALIGDDEAEEALRLIASAPEPHPIMEWGRVLALLALEKDATTAFKSAMEYAPRVFEYLVTAPLTDRQYEEALMAKDQVAYAAHLFRTLLRKRKKLNKALKQLAR